MRHLLLAAGLATLLGGGPLSAQSVEDRIRGVISDQIEAFKADDFAAAFTHASPSIKQMFGNSERFGEMVQSGYPMVLRPKDVRFSALREERGRTMQTVIVTDQNGTLHFLDYEMLQTGEAWQINGVTLRRPGDAGA